MKKAAVRDASCFTVEDDDGGRYASVRSLWIMVIIRSAQDRVMFWDSPKLEEERWARTGHRWLFGRSAACNSFESVCFWLGVSPDVIRKWALSLTKEDVQKLEHNERRTEEEIRARRTVQVGDLVRFSPPREPVGHAQGA